MTRYGLKRIFFWVLLAAGTAASAWWTLHIPYRPGAVLEAVPVNATWVSLHRAPAARWPQWGSNGVIRALTARAGLELDALAAEVETPRGSAWFRRLGGREAAIAYVPAMPGRGRPAWVISCWAGGYSQRLRWLLAISGDKPVPGPWSDLSHPVWRLKAAGLPPDLRLSLGIRDGVVVMAISSDPLAVLDCLEAAEGLPQTPSIRALGMEERLTVPGRPAQAADRGWLVLPESGTEWVLEADTLEADRFQAVARTRSAVPAGLMAAAGGDTAPLAGLTALAEGTASVPWPVVRGLLLNRAGDWLGPVDALVREAAGTDQARIVAAVYGGEHAARIRSLFGGGVESFVQGLKVPTFVCAIPVTDEAAAQAAVVRFLDRMNRLKPIGLVTRPAGICYGWNVTAIEATRGELYKNFAQSEQVAFTVARGWLVVGSHLGSLENLLPAISHEANPSGPGRAGADLRVDGPDFNRTMGKFAAALSLVFMGSESPSAEQGRARMGLLREWLKTLEPAGRVEMRALPDGTGLQIELRTEAGAARRTLPSKPAPGA
ncbi:MAG: hypothetical protein R6X19_08645 [Kiritimatiellia bacterium]